MTTHLTSTDLIDAITSTGMHVFDDSNIRATFESLDQEAVSHAQVILLRQGFRFADSTFNDFGVYELTFDAPPGSFPAPIVLRYVSRGYSHPSLALCYIEEDRLEQFTLPYCWSAMSPHSRDGNNLMNGFLSQYGDRTFYWVPVLRLSPLVKL